MWNAIFSAVLAFLGSLFKKSDGEKLDEFKDEISEQVKKEVEYEAELKKRQMRNVLDRLDSKQRLRDGTF